MEKIDSLFVIIVILNINLSASATIVVTNNGLMEGLSKEIKGKTIYYFLGIPFAEPPVGKLRFKKPVPKSNFNSTYYATEIKPVCYQPQNIPLMSEDCLYLNIWTPSLEKSCKLPVMFWIHGDSFLIGSATLLVEGFNVYDGTQLSLRDVIVVTSNFRLGAFGYLYGGSDEAPGNVGFWDQALVLKWIKDNIEAFGGDPDNICICGSSAGAISVSNHILSPISRNLFKNAIIQSGSTYTREVVSDRETALLFSQRFANNSNHFQTSVCNNNDWVQCLKNLSADQLNLAQILIAIELSLDAIVFWPIFGDEFLPKDPIKALKDGDFKRDCNVLIGHNEMEGYLQYFGKLIGFNGRYNPQTPYIQNNSKDITYNDIIIILSNSKIKNTIANAYTDPFPNTSPVDILTSNLLRRSASYAIGDYYFNCPTVLFGVKLVMNSEFIGNVYQYRLTYANSKSYTYGSVWANATHQDELPLVFGRPLSEKTNNWTKTDRIVSRKVMTIWTQFAKNGNPPDLKCEKWPRYQYFFGDIIASYVELNVNLTIRYDRYKGDDGYFPCLINDCLTFWDQILTNQFCF